MKHLNHLRGVWAVTALALLAAGFVSSPAAAADKVPSARLLPANVFAYFSFPNVEELKTRWEKTSLSELRQDPAFAAFWKQVDEQLEKATEEFEKNTKLKINELLEIPAGEVAAVLMKPPRGPLAAVAFLDFGKSEEMVDQLLGKLEDAMKDQNADRSVQEFENTRIVVYKFPGAEEAKGPFKPTFSYFVKDTQLVVGSDVTALESILSRWGGEGQQSFADDRIYKHILEQCKTEGSEPILTWFVNPIESLKAAISAGAEGNPQAAMALGFLPLLGLSDFRGMGGTADWATGGFEGISKTMLYVDQPPQGLLNLFHFPATDLTPPNWVGEKTGSYTGANWDVEGAYQAVENLFDTFQGAGALGRVLDDLAEKQGGPGIHVKKDVLDQLSGRFHVVNQGVENLEEPQVPKLLVSIGVRNAKTMKDFLGKVVKDQGLPAEPREFRGETIFDIAAGNNVTVSLSVFNNALMVATDVSLLEQVIRGDRTQKPLAESAAYRQLAAHFPEKTSILSFQRSDEQIKVFYEQARSGKFNKDNNDIPIDLTTLPPFEALQKYLPITGSYTIPNENGVLFVNLSLKANK